VKRGIKVRLLAFLILSAVGIVYVAASYLGLVDKVLGRGFEMSATLPASGGLYIGSEVDYRGVAIGKVVGTDVIPSGVRVRISMKPGTRLPTDSAVFVHNLSAVGEQYLDFEPKSAAGPFAKQGTTIAGNADSIPTSTDTLLINLNSFVNSVNRNNLSTVVAELGTMFRNTAEPLQRLVDSGSKFINDARTNEAATIQLLDTGKTVLATQRANSLNIRSFARNLAALSGTLRGSDADLRTILQGGTPAVKEVDSLLKGLEPTLPVFIGNLVTVNQVVTARLPALEQLLVTFPSVLSNGFTGTPGDGYGHINLQLNYAVPPCTDGYIPPKDWRPGTDTTTKPVFHAVCKSGPPLNMRGTKYAPPVGAAGSVGPDYRVAPYNAKTGEVDQNLTLGRHTVFGDKSWQWMLVGPVSGE
jgi:phospholipid/cholesterol/gamma-HCH transport system substrate-binding protein